MKTPHGERKALLFHYSGVDLPVADDIKVLGVVLDRRLTFHKHVSAVARSCNYHAHSTPADYGTGTDTGL